MTARQTAGIAAEERAAMKGRATFAATLFAPDPTEKIGSGILLALPQDVSATLPSRGMTLVQGTINGAPFQAVLEPDGQGSHWFKVSEALRAAANADVGDTVTLEIAPTQGLAGAHGAGRRATRPRRRSVGAGVMARYHPDGPLGLDPLDRRHPQPADPPAPGCRGHRQTPAGKRRPCCFDRNQCTLTDA